MGQFITHQKEDSVSLLYYQKSLKISREINDTESIIISLINIGDTHNLNNNPDKAFNHFEQAIKVAREVGDENSIAYCFQSLGTV